MSYQQLPTQLDYTRHRERIYTKPKQNMRTHLKVISIIIPVYNEQDNIKRVHQTLTKILSKLRDKYAYEIIFIDDGSKDQSREQLTKLANTDKKVKYIEFSRNFGKEIATTAGLFYCRGDSAIMFDADMQFPAEQIPQFIAKWEKGADVVTGIRLKNSGEGIIKKSGSALFNKLMDYISEVRHVPQSTDFKLIDRKVINEFNQFTERNRITRGLIDWLGFEKDYIYFQANERQFGTPSYNVKKLIGLATSSIISLSTLPLKFALYLGSFTTVVAALVGVFMFIERFLMGDPWGLNFSGPAILAVINMFSSGVILICLGLIALYIGQIHTEATNRPIFVIRNKKNLN